MTYSIEFRTTCVNQVNALISENVPTSQSIKRVALLSSIDCKTLKKWCDMAWNTRSVMPIASKEDRRMDRESKRIFSGLPPSIPTDEHMSFVKDLLRADSTIEMLDLSQKILERYGYLFQPAQIYMALHNSPEHWTSKVTEYSAREADPILVRLFVEQVYKQVPIYLCSSFFVFGDGTHLKEKDCHVNRGMAPSGERAVSHRGHAHWYHGGKDATCAFLSMNTSGPLTVDCQVGSVTAETMAPVWHRIVNLMSPFPSANSILVLDNAPVYDKTFITTLFYSKGCKVLWIPQYNPRLNCTEPCHNLAKRYIFKNYAKRFPQISLKDWFIEAYNNVVTPTVAIGEFEHIGISVSAAERIRIME
jgi:hypothetical protein